MFVRKLTVIALPLLFLAAVCGLIIIVAGFNPFFGSMIPGVALGIGLGLLLPLSGATKLREPFAYLLWLPAIVIILVLLYQYIDSMGTSLPVLRLLATNEPRVILAESAFAAYMITFSVRTGRK